MNNPWDLKPQINQMYGQMNQDSNTAYTGIQQGQQNIQNLQGQQQSMQNMDGGYPAMANSYGLGSQPALQSAMTTSTNAPKTNDISTASQGFNPWSMIGESNAR